MQRQVRQKLRRALGRRQIVSRPKSTAYGRGQVGLGFVGRQHELHAVGDVGANVRQDTQHARLIGRRIVEESAQTFADLEVALLEQVHPLRRQRNALQVVQRRLANVASRFGRQKLSEFRKVTVALALRVVVPVFGSHYHG